MVGYGVVRRLHHVTGVTRTPVKVMLIETDQI